MNAVEHKATSEGQALESARRTFDIEAAALGALRARLNGTFAAACRSCALPSSKVPPERRAAAPAARSWARSPTIHERDIAAVSALALVDAAVAIRDAA